MAACKVRSVLITGASGFVGKYLTAELRRNDFTVKLTSPFPYTWTDPGDGCGHVAEICDLTSPHEVEKLLSSQEIDAVVHLAALSHVGQAEHERENLLAVNVGATDNLCRVLYRRRKPVVFMFVSSALVYSSQKQDRLIFNESTPVDPQTPYGASKLAAECVVRAYASDWFIPYIVRPLSHTGVGQSTDFVCPAFAKRVVDAQDGEDIIVGNIKTERDFSDVRDIVRAYRLILQKLPKPKVYVLGSGVATSIEKILQCYIALSGKKLHAKVSQELLRQSDPSCIVGDSSLAQETLGWQCEYPLEKTLHEIFHAFLRPSHN